MFATLFFHILVFRNCCFPENLVFFWSIHQDSALLVKKRELETLIILTFDN